MGLERPEKKTKAMAKGVGDAVKAGAMSTVSAMAKSGAARRGLRIDGGFP